MIPVTVTFYGDVGFDRSYNHVIDFSNETERENYFSSRIVKTVQDCAYNKPMNSLQIRCPYEDALNFTYCKFIIGSNPNSQKKIYAWVDDVILLTDQKDENNVFIPVLQINISIDPWQTFLFNFTVGESFVAREHVDRFKANTDGSRGWCLPNSSDNNSIGVEKRLSEVVDLAPLRDLIKPGDLHSSSRVYWLVIQNVRNLTTEPYKSVMDVYLVPVTVEMCKFGHHIETNIKYTLQLTDVYDDEFLSTLGLASNTVASVSLLPFDIATYETKHVSTSPILQDYYSDVTLNFADNKVSLVSTLNDKFALKVGSAGYDVIDNEFNYDVNLTINDDIEVPSTDVYSINHEPQLYKEPYKTISVIDANGLEVGKLPDICANFNNGFKSITVYILIDSVSVRIRIIPKVGNVKTDSKYWIEFVAPNVDVIRNQWLEYLLQERETTRQMLSSQVNQQTISTAIGGVSSAVGMGGQQAMGVGRAQVGQSELGAFASGAIVGLGVGAINTVGGYIANKHFAFEQQDIREKAIKRKANNIIQSGTLKSLVDPIKIIRTECDETTIEIKAKEFHKYGYSVFFYETPNLKSRKYFNFIATNIVKIEGSLNNQIKMALSEIFNNGVTIWHGDYINELTGIGDYSKENIERSLL